MEDSILSSLCATCHTEKPKYRCPRCKAQTCSLPCYQRHQQRAACSGKRDPAIYVKKSYLATPAGIDHDYNYLKSVERTIDDASQHVKHRGIGIEARASKQASKAWQAGSALQRYLVDNRITVMHAPKGMSRQRTNQTRTTNRGNTMWTVEWINAHGERDIQNNSLASASLHELHSTVQTEKRNAQKRRLHCDDPAMSQRKVKRRCAELHKASEAEPHDQRGPQEGKFHLQAMGEPLEGAIENLDGTIKVASEESGEVVRRDVDAPEPPRSGIKMEHDDSSQSDVEFILKSKNPTRSRDGPKVAKLKDEADHDNLVEPKTEQYYYLLRPQAGSTARVLIPLSTHTSLTENLRDRSVQEYPTIYILPQPRNKLPAEFLLEKDYMATTRLASTTSYGSSGDVKPDDALDVNARRTTAGSLDASEILNMLKRDITI